MKLEQLLNEGLGFWIEDYHTASKNESKYADMIMKGIQVERKKLSNSEQSKIDQLLEDDNYTFDQEFDELRVDEAYQILKQGVNENKNKQIPINESIIKKAIGAVGGYAIGPAIGKILMEVLGVEKRGILADFLQSRVLTSALGSEIANQFGK